MKSFDHGMDAMRYMVAHLDGISDAAGSNYLEYMKGQLEERRKERAA